MSSNLLIEPWEKKTLLHRGKLSQVNWFLLCLKNGSSWVPKIYWIANLLKVAASCCKLLQLTATYCKVNSCKSLWVPASSCKSLWVPVIDCKFLWVSLQVHANSSMFSKQRKIKWNATEILQHLHACNSNTEVFYGREAELKILKQYFQGPCNKPFVLYGKGGSGKTAMLSIAASKGLQEWFNPGKPLLIIRYHSFQLSKSIPLVDCIVFCLTQNDCYRFS